MFFVFIILFISTIIAVISLIVSWSTHISMTIDNCERENCGWATYNEFMDNFKTFELTRRNRTNSFYNCRNNSCFANSIIKFEGKGMLLSPLAWLNANIYIKKLTKKSKIKKFKDL